MEIFSSINRVWSDTIVNDLLEVDDRAGSLD